MEACPHRNNEPLITLSHVTLRRGNRMLLANTTWEIRSGENWAILGPNGSGKSALAGAVRGDVPHVRGKVIRHDPDAAGSRIGCVSFELQEEILAREERRDEARSFSGRGRALTAGELLRENDGDPAALDRIVDTLGIRSLLGQGFRTLSNGEIRKLLIARALLPAPKLLILDDPFAGLDAGSRISLAEAVTKLMAGGTQILLVAQRPEEVIPGISHVLVIRNSRVALAGRREEVLTPGRIRRFGQTGKPLLKLKLSAAICGESSILERNNPFRFRSLTPQQASGGGPALASGFIPPPAEGREALPPGEPLVEMKDVRVAYGESVVLAGLNWTVRRGENWAVVGPNGSGKSTLLSLITGDNLQVYANEVYLFGKRRGEGESVWAIRQRLGVVSPELQLRYRKPGSVREVVLSGFFDSIGLYRKPGREHEALADRWLELLALEDRADRPFSQLSYGERRLVLIARAMVKSPELLILDEPCQGLDGVNRQRVLSLIEGIGSESRTGLIYVTHHEEEMVPSIRHTLKLEKTARVAGCEPNPEEGSEDQC